MKWNEFLKMLNDSGVKSVTFEMGGLRQPQLFGPDVSPIKVGAGDADDLKKALEDRVERLADLRKESEAGLCTGGIVPVHNHRIGEPDPVVKPKVDRTAHKVDITELVDAVDDTPLAEPASESVAEVEVELEAEVEIPRGKTVFETFVDVVAKDDGNGLAVEHLISKMDPTDLHRVHVEYGLAELGVDTDVPEDKLRAAIMDCFK